MKTQIIGKNIEVTPAMKEHVEKKLGVLSKYVLIPEDTIARVLARTYKVGQKVEITIPTKFGILRSEVVHGDFYGAVELAIDKLEDQIRRQKTRIERKHRSHLTPSFAETIIEDTNTDEDIPVRTKTVFADEMSMDQAILEMELSGHNFYVYTDEETGDLSIVYKRREIGYGCLEVAYDQ